MINDPNVFNDVEMNKEHGSNRAGNGQHHGIYGDHFASDDQDYLHGNSAGSRINTRDNKVSSGLLTSIYGDPFARNNGNTVPAQGLRASYNLTASHKSNTSMQGVYSDKTKKNSIYPPLAFMLDSNSDYRLIIYSNFKDILRSYQSGLNLIFWKDCTYLMKVELLIEILGSYSQKNSGDSNNMSADSCEQDRKNAKNKGQYVLYLSKLYINFCRFMALEKNSIYDHICKNYGTIKVWIKNNITNNKEQQDMDLDRYIRTILIKKIVDLTERLLEENMIVEFLDKINQIAPLPNDLKSEIANVIHFGSKEENYEVPKLIDTIKTLHNELYSKNVTSDEQKNYPIYNIYANARCYFGVALREINSSDQNDDFKNVLRQNLKKYFLELIKKVDLPTDQTWLNSLCLYFYSGCTDLGLASQCPLIKLINFICTCIDEIIRQYYLNRNSDGVVDTNNFNQNYITFGFRNPRDTFFSVKYDNQTTDFHVLVEHKFESKNWRKFGTSNIYLSFTENSFCALIKVTSDQILLESDPLNVLGNISTPISCNLKIDGMSLHDLVDNVVKIVAFEYNCEDVLGRIKS